MTSSSSADVRLPAHHEILKPNEAALHLQLSPSTLAKMRLAGTGPRYIKAGRAVRYLRVDLAAWIESRFAESTTDSDRRLPKRLVDPAATLVSNVIRKAA
jgi:predicted DNA-binding transcriptional regulator AlpA